MKFLKRLFCKHNFKVGFKATKCTLAEASAITVKLNGEVEYLKPCVECYKCGATK